MILGMASICLVLIIGVTSIATDSSRNKHLLH